MKNLILFNRSGMSPEVTCRKGRHAIESIVSRFSVASLICLCMLTVGVGQMWGANVTGTFTKITSTDALTTGYYIIVGSEDASQKVSGATVANPNYALGNAVDNNKRVTGVSVTITSGTTISNPDETLVYLITKSSSNYTFLNVNTNKYLYQASTTSGKGMGFKEASANFTCAEYNSSSPRGFKFTLDGASNNIFKYQNQNKYFANYTGAYSTSMTPVRLFKAYKVTYDGNGKTEGTVPTDATYYSGNGSTSVTTKTNSGNLVKTGYTFAGWNTKADGAGTHYAAGGTFTISANTTLYAEWESAAVCGSAPTVSNGSLKGSVSSTSATAQCTGGITNIGGAGCSLTSYGFAVGTASDPTIGGTLTSGGKTYEVGSSIAASTGFEKLIDGLSASTTYYVRPYATNGAGTNYGTQFSFTTSAACTGAPTVTAGSTGTITSTSAVLNCSSGISVLGTGGCAIESYGFVMNTTGSPSITDTKYEVGTTYTTTGTSFTKTISSGLTEGTTYYVRPYATNGYSTGYGTQVSFGTPKITVSQSSRAFGDRAVGGSYEMSFTVEGVYLQGNISIAKSGTNQAMFSIDNATVTQTDGTAPTTTITVTYSPSAAGSHSATLTLSSTNATNKTVSLSGTGKYKVTWMVNGTENSTNLVASGAHPTFPTAPSSCDAKKVFVGWTESNIGSSPTDVAPTFITTAATISTNKTYYAVFAKRGRFDRVTGPSSLAAGQELVIVSNKYSTAITTGIGYASQPTEDADTLTSATTTEAMIWLLTGNSTDGWRITKPGDGYLLGVGNLPGNNSSNTATLNSNNTNSTWGIGQNTYTTNVLYISNKTTATCALEASTASANWVVYNSSSYNSNQYCALRVYASTLSKFVTKCCSDPELAYGTGSVTKTYGTSAFTHTLTNSHGVAVTYSSSDPTVATVNGSGEVTILKAGSTTITASSIAQTISTVDYCADEASYTLIVNKADITPTLTYTPSSVAVGSSTSAPTVGGNPGSGGVTYAITSATPLGCATINTSTGVVSGVAVGSVTVTATVAATTNHNGGSATANVTITAASGYCISAFNSSNNGITSGFSNGGSGNEYTLNYTIPGKDGSSNWPQYWIGENEAWASFSANALFADMHFTHSDATLGLAEGATGKLHIWDDNKASGSNLWVKFEPDGYGFRWGGAGEWDQAANTKAFTVDPGDANVYWTDIVTLDGTNNTTWNYYVGLQTASGYVYSGVDNEASDSRGISRTRSVTAMKVSNGTAGSWKGTYLSSEPTGSRGKFRIWNNNIDDYNFYCHWVPFYRVTYDGSGASGSTAASADVCCEGNAAARTVKAAANGFTVPTGKSFGGWASSPENAAAKIVAYAANADVILTGSITLYAIWNDIDYTVTVNQSPSVGATTTGQTTTAHYNGTINLTTTVPSGYRFVNWTTSDGFSITNSTSATTASFTMPNKSVTVTANFQQTHKVDWYVGGSAPANKIGDDGQTTVVDHGGKIEDFPATTPDGSACDKEFVGWTNTSSYVHGTSPLFNDVAGSPTINADAQFYAVFAAEGGSSEPTNKFSVTLNVASPSVPSGYTLSQATEWKSSTHRQDGSNDPAYIKVYHTSTKLFSSLPSTITIKAGLYGGTARDMSEDGSDYYPYVFFTDNSGNEIAGSAKAICTSVTNSSVEKSVDMDVSKATNAYGIGIRHKKISGFNLRYSSITLTYAESSYTGHTINCADCGTSVTPTYTASPTGGTVSVTKSASPVTRGSTVKTCTAVDLTVTLTPATHYDLTGFTATGLTTGTATITPAVGSTLPVSVAQTFTVTVSAGATGTLTLAPTFTAQTPLSITLETHSKGTFTPIGDVYSGESFTFPTVTPSDAECSSFLGWIEGTTFVDDGTETDPTAITGLANYHAAGSSSGTLTTNKTYTAVYGEKDTQVVPAYQKVTSAPSNWSGDYLIVRDDNSRAFDGSLSTLDAADNYIGVTISDGSITANSTVNASKWKIAKVGETSNYTIKSASGYYIGRTANSNGLNSSTSEEYTNTLAYSTDHVDITSSAGPKLQMNGGARFRYYGTSQQVLQLYKYNPDAEVVAYTYCTNPACTPRYRVTMNSATGGSPSADKVYEHADETITLTANPSSGYSFTSWTITKTTGGDNVTSTLLTGDKPTTANTTFTMPAYDITIAATYTKKMVSTLEVKDGATVVSTTIGPVSGTVNISTGANKTLDVVITPSDAYDHSWTATVSAGSTYASITNVTDDGFRVNGLAQGDATITVNAPNDGSAKSVTLTVQVRDIMPEEIILKRDGSNTPIETLIMYYDETNSKGQYVKVNVGYSPANPTNKAFTFSSALTGKVGSHSHAPASGYEVLVANGVTSDAVNCTFTSSADGSVTKVLAVTVLPILSDRFVDYVHGNATQTVSARLSDDRYSIIPDINTPSLSDASDANPTSEDCETSHYHLVGWLPQTTAEALWAAGTPITDATEGLVRAGESVEATGQTWCAIWAEEAE